MKRSYKLSNKGKGFKSILLLFFCLLLGYSFGQEVHSPQNTLKFYWEQSFENLNGYSSGWKLKCDTISLASCGHDHSEIAQEQPETITLTNHTYLYKDHFQFYVADASGKPVNTDNIRVFVDFENTTSEVIPYENSGAWRVDLESYSDKQIAIRFEVANVEKMSNNLFLYYEK